MKHARRIVFYKQYFKEFYLKQPSKVQLKIEFVFKILCTVDRVPKKFLEHMAGTDGLFEIRIEAGSDIFRVFCCFDKGNLVILFNGFQKKTQKTPKQELEIALKLKREYFAEIKNKK